MYICCGGSREFLCVAKCIALLFVCSVPQYTTCVKTTADVRHKSPIRKRWEAYVQDHMHMFAVNRAVDFSKMRLLVVDVSFGAGWGNRLPALVTGGLLALLTNRTLVCISSSHADLSSFLKIHLPWNAIVSRSVLNVSSYSKSVTDQDWTIMLTHADYHVPLMQSNMYVKPFF